MANDVGWWHPIECSNEHDEGGNCLDANGSLIGWREERPMNVYDDPARWGEQFDVEGADGYIMCLWCYGIDDHADDCDRPFTPWRRRTAMK